MRIETRRQPTRPLVQAGIESVLGGLAELLGSSRVWTALLHGSIAFPEALPYSIVDYLRYSRVTFAPRDPRSTGQFPFYPQTSYLCVYGSLIILKQGPRPKGGSDHLLP